MADLAMRMGFAGPAHLTSRPAAGNRAPFSLLANRLQAPLLVPERVRPQIDRSRNRKSQRWTSRRDARKSVSAGPSQPSQAIRARESFCFRAAKQILGQVRYKDNYRSEILSSEFHIPRNLKANTAIPLWLVGALSKAN
jgi:hypothetical protein